MGKTSADRRLAKGDLANLYAGNTAQGWRIVKQVPMAQGFEKVAQRKWRRLDFLDGSFAGFQPVEALERLSVAGKMPGWSPTTITAKESQMNAGLYGPSRTMGMTEWERLHRRGLKKRLT
jgi:hypothetical protein